MLPARAAEREIKESRGGGVRYEGRGVRVENRPDAGKGATHSAQRRCALHDAAVTRKWDDNGPDTDGIRRARSEMTHHAKHGQLKIGFGT